MNDSYLDSARKQFQYYKMLGDKTFAQVSDQDLFWQYNDDSNSIATIVKHLWGNMLSRWTDFLTSDGEKPWRERDAEFENDWTTREQVIDRWNEGWNCLFQALNTLTPDDLQKEIFIRNQGHTVMEAINRQLAHYPYHVGQIVFIGKRDVKKSGCHCRSRRGIQTLTTRINLHNRNAGNISQMNFFRRTKSNRWTIFDAVLP